jgi:Holliday junction resolvase
MPMNPPTVTQQRHRVGKGKNGKVFFYDPPELLDAKAKLAAHPAKHIPEQPFTGAVRLVVKWCFPVSGSHSDGEYKTTKPDTDNLQKALKDIMTGLRFWKDDALVASEVAEKFWADVSGIWICIREIGQ